MGRDKSVQTKAIRLAKVLKVFTEKEKVSSSWLSKEFQTTPRTIQRDLLLLKEAGFPLQEVRKGTYWMSKDLVKNLEVFDDTELALVVALRSLVAQLGPSFREAADGVLDRLYEYAATMPVFVKIDDPVALDSALLNRIVKAVNGKRRVHFQYAGHEKALHPVTLEPYRVAYFSGFWYLIGNEPATGILKRYALDRITAFTLTKNVFKGIPENLDSTLRGSANIWFAGEGERRLEVKILVDTLCAHYFKRRKMFPTQEILEEREDGSLIVSYRVGQYGEVLNILKSWLPHILILEPEEVRKGFLADMKGWVKRQAKEV